MKKLLKKWLQHSVLICILLGFATSIVLFGLQSTGVLQGLELRAFDQQLLQRPELKIDDRITVIGETEPDIRRYGHPLSDQVFADAVQKLETEGTRVIGIDKYRDLPVAPGTDNLKNVLEKNSNIVWIFFAGNSTQTFVPAPAAIAGNPLKTAFNNIIEDPDGVSRRGLLFLDVGESSYYSFPLLISLHYLAADNIPVQIDEQQNLNLNGIAVPKIDPNFGVYRHADTGGYQAMLEFPALPQSFRTFTLSDLLDDKIPKDALKDKIVLFGAMAPSLQDFWLLPNQITRYGIEHHAYFVSQLLNIATQKKQPLQAMSDRFEYGWLLLWCLLGAMTGLFRAGVLQFLFLVTVQIFLLVGINIFLLNESWWLPFVSPLLGWTLSMFLSVFYFFTRSRAERGQLMQLFSRHVSPEVATHLWEVREEFFSANGIKPDTLTATVLFTDLSNFTTIAEKMQPLVLMNWLNEYMEVMSNLVMEHGGMVDKYIGDAIMAIFGVPVKRDSEEGIANDARQAVACAVEFNRHLVDLNARWKAQGLPEVTMRTGIYTGSVVAGSFGSSKRMEYTVIGDTVNTASRFESFDKTIAPPTKENPCRILIGDLTYDYVRDLYQTEVVGDCLLKGRTAPSILHRVIAPVNQSGVTK